jgi:hypothetical protein
MTQPPLDADKARHDLYEILAKDAGFDAKAEQALALGERYLGVENAHLTEIHPDSNYWKAIVSTDPPDGEFPAGEVLSLQTTYCRRVLAEDDSIALHDAPSEGWADDPAFEEHGLRCYHGTPVIVDGDQYGTVCFVSASSRREPFTAEETLFAEMIARLLEHELQRERYNTRIERLDRFASVLAHDLRNPLSVAHGYVELASDSTDSEHLAVAAEALDRMQAMIADVLTMARQGSAIEVTEEVRLPALCEQCWQSVETAEAKLVLADDVTIRAAPDRLQHLFENLFRNAVEHGSDDVTVTVGPLDETGFFIGDTGPGMTENERDKVFERGYTTTEDGTGFGLAIARQIVEAHGEIITVDEGRNGSARFEIQGIDTRDT